MFSNDKNIETISELVMSVREYLNIHKELLKLNIVEKSVRLLTLAALTVMVCFFLLLTIIFASFAVAIALTPLIGGALAYLSVAAFYIIILILFIAKRHSWIERPLVRILTAIITE